MGVTITDNFGRPAVSSPNCLTRRLVQPIPAHKQGKGLNATRSGAQLDHGGSSLGKAMDGQTARAGNGTARKQGRGVVEHGGGARGKTVHALPRGNRRHAGDPHRQVREADGERARQGDRETVRRRRESVLFNAELLLQEIEFQAGEVEAMRMRLERTIRLASRKIPSPVWTIEWELLAHAIELCSHHKAVMEAIESARQGRAS